MYRLVLVQIGLCTGWLLYILVCVQNDYVLGCLCTYGLCTDLFFPFEHRYMYWLLQRVHIEVFWRVNTNTRVLDGEYT